MMHDVLKEANVLLPKDKVCDYPRSVGMNRAEMHGLALTMLVVCQNMTQTIN